MLKLPFRLNFEPPEAASYRLVLPEKNDGKIAHVLTEKDVPVNAFWSITVYDKDGYLPENEYNVYAFNDVTAKKNEDGSITIAVNVALPSSLPASLASDEDEYTARLQDFLNIRH